MCRIRWRQEDQGVAAGVEHVRAGAPRARRARAGRPLDAARARLRRRRRHRAPLGPQPAVYL